MQQSKPISLSRFGALAWLLVIVGVTVWLMIRVNNGPTIDANILASLPGAQRDDTLNAAAEKFTTRQQRNLVVLVSAGTESTARDVASVVFDRLSASHVFESLKLKQDSATLRHSGAFYFPFRFYLLSKQARQELLAGDVAAFKRRLLERYFSPIDGLTSELVKADPLLVLPDFLSELGAVGTSRAQLKDGYLMIREENRVHILLLSKLNDSPFSLTLQERLVPLLRELRVDLASRFPRSNISIAGVFPHAAAGTESARQEVSTVGLGSLLGIFILFIVVFRSVRPFFMSFLSIAIGCMGGFAVCLAIFGQVQILTLVFGASLVGISVDYSLHYFCESFGTEKTWSPENALRHVFPGISLGLVTSVIGFAGLLVAPLPSMREMGVFSSAGLIFAYLSVIAFYPLSSERMARSRKCLPGWVEAYRQFWECQARSRIGLILFPVLFLAIIGCLKLVPLDDIRMPQARDPLVTEEEDRVKALIGQDLASQFFIVSGRNESELLQRQEDLSQALQVIESDGKLGGFIALSDFVPSPPRQRENRTLLGSLISDDSGIFEALADRIGLPVNARRAYAEAFGTSGESQGLLLENWLNDPVSESVRHLWLGDTDQGVSAAVVISNLRDPGVLRRLAEQRAGVAFIDSVQDISDLFRSYRNQMIWLAAASYVLVTLLLIMRYGFSGALAVVAVPLGAVVVCFGALGFLAEPISLFNIMALLLILGIGVDYGIFFREAGTVRPPTFLAVTMSAVTTILAFGLLAVSSTAAVHSFGITLLIGISAAFFLSPLAAMAASGRSSEELSGELL